MQKQEKFLLEGHRSTFLGQKHKSAIWDRTPPPPPTHQTWSICVQEGLGIPNLQTELIYFEICSRVIVILLIWVSSAVVGWVGQVGGWGYLGWSTIVYMSSGVFKGKESSNRIELSQLVQDLLNFGDLGSLQLWGVGGWGWGCPHTCMHTQAHTCKEIANGCQHVYRDSGVFPIVPIISMSSLSSPHHPQAPI